VLPDGIFLYQKFKLGHFLEGLVMKNVGILFAVWYILQSSGIFYVHLVYFVVNM
jgi:hypothetical protein